MLCILNVGTVPMLCILYVGTVPTLCILNVGTVPTFSHSLDIIPVSFKIELNTYSRNFLGGGITLYNNLFQFCRSLLNVLTELVGLFSEQSMYRREHGP